MSAQIKLRSDGSGVIHKLAGSWTGCVSITFETPSNWGSVVGYFPYDYSSAVITCKF